MSVQFSVDARGMPRVRRAMANLSHMRVNDLLDNIGQLIENQVRTRILEEKVAPDGSAWKPLSPGYAAWKASKKGSSVGMLEFDGHLQHSIQHVVHGNEMIEVGSNVEYADEVHYVRPYLGLSKLNEKDLMDMIKVWFAKVMGRKF